MLPAPRCPAALSTALFEAALGGLRFLCGGQRLGQRGQLVAAHAGQPLIGQQVQRRGPGAGALLGCRRARPVRRWGRWCSSTARAGRAASIGSDRSCCAGHGDARAGSLPVSSSACTCSPVRVRVAAMVATTTSWLVNGRPRQFMVIWENSRCSILFHLLVPGGKWQTVIVQAGLGRERRQLGLPEPVAVAVGAARVRGDQQPAGAGVVGWPRGPATSAGSRPRRTPRCRGRPRRSPSPASAVRS